MKKKILTKRIEKKKHSVISLWDRTSKLAQDEGKIPIVALCQKYRKGFWVVIKDDDLDKVHKIMEEDNATRNWNIRKATGTTTEKEKERQEEKEEEK